MAERRPRFSILVPRHRPLDCAVLWLPPGIPDPERPAQGVRMDGLYPPRVALRMAAEERGIRVPDVITNAFGYWLVSGRLRAILEHHALAEVEMLPFVLLDHRGRVARDDCAIVNVVGTLDAASSTGTEGVANPLYPGQLMFASRVTLDEDRIAPDVNLGRLGVAPWLFAVRDDLRAVLEGAGITGAELFEQGETLP